MASLQDKILIITGSASGIGLAAAKLALDEGASVLGVDIVASPSSLTGHPNYKFLQGNLCHERTPKDVVQACIEAFGGQIDGLLNVAGVMDANQSVDSLSDEIWERCISVNLTAPVKLMREVIVIMQQQKSGNIVNIASKAALSGAVAGVAYTASKHGLVGATKNVAWRFKHENIRCNTLCPGGVLDTGIRDGIDMKEWDMDALKTMALIHQSHSCDRDKGIGLCSEDVANALLFLVSNKSKGINGAIIPIDNAWSTI